MNNNEHYITQSFVKSRFGTSGFVYRYDVKNDRWKRNVSPRRVFSAAGYTQFLEEGQPVDNGLEESFGDLENQLQFILPALDDAATRAETRLPEEVYLNLCWYCAYLSYLSPFAKAKAPALFVIELNFQLKQGNLDYLLGQGMPESVVQTMKTQYELGCRFILQGENYLQLAFRNQFIRNCKQQAQMFRHHTKWRVYNSPLELPISDIALIDMPVDDAALFIFPISSSRVLIGRVERPTPRYFTETIIYGDTLQTDAAEDLLDIICLSAVKAVVCKNKIDVKAIRERAAKRKVTFNRITNLDEVLSAGTKVFDREKDVRLVPVSPEEYKKFVLSHIGPPR